MLDDYKDLELDNSSVWEDVKRNYFEQLKVWHPDRFANDESLRLKGEEKTKEITKAFNLLKKELSHLESNGVQVHWDKPILPQLASAGMISFKSDTPRRQSPNNSYSQEPLVGQNIKKAKQSDLDRKLEEQNESIWKPQLIAASIISGFAFLFAAYFLYKNIITQKVVYGPPADLSSFKKENTPKDEFKENLIKSVGVEQLKSGEGVVEGQLGSVRVLSGIDKGESSDTPDIIKYASRCDLEGVKRVVEKGTKIDKEDADGLSALSWAAKKNCEQMAKYLLSKGANPNHMSINGFTPLAWAKWFKNIEVIKVLELDKRFIKKR